MDHLGWENRGLGVLERKVGPKIEGSLSRSELGKKNIGGKILEVGEDPRHQGDAWR